MDNYDRKLLALLEKDGRETTSTLAKQLHSSQQVVSYRIKSLEQKGVIEGYYTILNLASLGYTSYRTMIRLTNCDESKRTSIINYLVKHSNVLWMVEIGGRWDLLVNFTAKNILHYSRLLKELRNKFPKQIQNYDVLTTVEGIYFGRRYFSGENEKKVQSFGGENNEEVSLDKLDLNILKEMSENGRTNSVDIADKVKASPNTIILRMKSLKKKGVIQGVKPLINLSKLEMQGFKALIKFQNITEKREVEIIKDLKKYNQVVGIIRVVGSWDFEIEFEVKTQEEMLELSRNFRDSLKDVIKEFEILPLYKEYRYNFFPRDLLN